MTNIENIVFPNRFYFYFESDKDMKVHWRRSFEKCEDLDDIRITLNIPNFSYDLFQEISGISKDDFDNKL
jgi:hypothetical protein